MLSKFVCSRLYEIWPCGPVKALSKRVRLAYLFRPDTSWRQQRPLPPCPPFIVLVPLKSSRFRHTHRVPFIKEEMPFCCPCPFQKRGSIQAWPVSGLANNRRHPQQLPWCPLQSSSTNLHCSHRSGPYKPVGKCMCPEVVPRS